MKILFDTYIYQLQKTGGINRYFVEIIKGLPEDFYPRIFPKIEEKLFVPFHPKLKNFRIPPSLRWSSALLKWRMRSMDLIHPTYYHLSGPLTWNTIPGKVVLTVYDFVMMKFSSSYSKSEKIIKDQRAAIQRADYIICISNSTRRDLLEYFPECESRSCVIPLAGSLRASQEGTNSPLQNKYFLYVGGRTFYKNFALTVRTFSLLWKKDKSLRLTVVGAPFNDEENNLLVQLGVQDAVILVEHPDDQVLSLLYQHAFLLFYPSEYEGFGLPPLEAMNMGVPVIALHTSSLPEVVGPGGILIEPQKAEPSVLADAVFSLLESESLYHQLSQSAIKQASLFSWNRTVEETLKIYKMLQ